MTNAEGSGTPMRGAVIAWLLAVLALLFAMIIVGGLTRLTDSGLSITEWKPVTGAVPPLSESAWEAEFEKYRQIPSTQLSTRACPYRTSRRSIGGSGRIAFSAV